MYTLEKCIGFLVSGCKNLTPLLTVTKETRISKERTKCRTYLNN
jgi:hypothetical protein